MKPKIARAKTFSRNSFLDQMKQPSDDNEDAKTVENDKQFFFDLGNKKLDQTNDKLNNPILSNRKNSVKKQVGKSITDMQVGSHNSTPTKPGILKVKNKFANLTPSDHDKTSQASGPVGMPTNNPRYRMQQNLKNKLVIDEKDIVKEDPTGETSSPVKFKFRLHNAHESKDSRMSEGEGGNTEINVDLRQHVSDTFPSSVNNSKPKLLVTDDKGPISIADNATEQLYVDSHKSDENFHAAAPGNKVYLDQEIQNEGKMLPQKRLKPASTFNVA